jgi:hypothetical protein
MDREMMAELLARKPFQPFEIHLSSGQIVVLKHPENALLTKGKILVVDPVTDVVAIVSLLHVANIQTLQNA